MDRLVSSASIADDVDALRERLVDDGYVYLPIYVDPEEAHRVQVAIRRALHTVGWLPSGDSLAVEPGHSPHFTAESFRTVYPAVQRQEVFHRLSHNPRLHTLMAGLLRGEIFCHPAKVARLSPPTAAIGQYATRAHQDFVVLHVASDVLTAWIALTPCTPQRQGLRILPRSHRNGFLPTDPAAGGVRPLYLSIPPDDPQWLASDYAVGDVVVFHSLTVHGGGPNTSDQLRLSADVRYQVCSDPLRAEFAHPHGWPRTPDWDELCADWTSHDWYRLPPDVSLVPMPTDISYEDFLSGLTAPPSRLLGARPHPNTMVDPFERRAAHGIND